MGLSLTWERGSAGGREASGGKSVPREICRGEWKEKGGGGAQEAESQAGEKTGKDKGGRGGEGGGGNDWDAKK